MTPFRAAVLGLVQGLTEFLPISSEAHLILTSRLLGWPDQGLTFDVSAHLGSLLAVIVYFRHDLVRIARQARSGGRDSLAARLLLATLPAAAAGALLGSWIAGPARSPVVIASSSIVFGLLLGWSDRQPQRRALEPLSTKAALQVGAAQALALIPGTSRSGVTITAARLLGPSREEAARLSFLLAIPLGVLVAVKQAIDLAGAPPGGVEWGPLLIGFTVSAASAYLAIHWLLAWLRRQSLGLFVVYRVTLGVGLLGLWLAASG
ncbi:MAG: undecaprenyl-diphosphate phosphatase [Thermoanaerobaculia bacterium]|nr:undecaprenyl-diphosphate phosphatase [Thermoanaerobaculia bacterium]